MKYIFIGIFFLFVIYLICMGLLMTFIMLWEDVIEPIIYSMQQSLTAIKNRKNKKPKNKKERKTKVKYETRNVGWSTFVMVQVDTKTNLARIDADVLAKTFKELDELEDENLKNKEVVAELLEKNKVLKDEKEKAVKAKELELQDVISSLRHNLDYHLSRENYFKEQYQKYKEMNRRLYEDSSNNPYYKLWMDMSDAYDEMFDKYQKVEAERDKYRSYIETIVNGIELKKHNSEAVKE